LNTTGFGDGQHSLDESASCFASSSEGKLAVDNSRTQGTFGGVIRRLDSWDLDKRLEPLSVVVQFPAHPDEALVSAAPAAK